MHVPVSDGGFIVPAAPVRSGSPQAGSANGIPKRSRSRIADLHFCALGIAVAGDEDLADDVPLQQFVEVVAPCRGPQQEAATWTGSSAKRR
jgi:hypothetical protein